ncbi:AAA family ATPase [Streptomyces sp. NPDC056161]|uniref:AAA family ATPase n=1 Tax=Streptomyces sp. NPDC056161 TaxID=3345732 RepID=UPI0035DCA0C3
MREVRHSLLGFPVACEVCRRPLGRCPVPTGEPAGCFAGTGSAEGGRVRRKASADSPRFVGRERELLRVTDALRRRPALVIIEGESGIGKSRLVREALAAVCPPFREALTLGPIVDAVRQAVAPAPTWRTSNCRHWQARCGRISPSGRMCCPPRPNPWPTRARSGTG